MSCGDPLASPQWEQELKQGREQEEEQELKQGREQEEEQELKQGREQEEEQELKQGREQEEELEFGAQVEAHWTRTLVNAEAFLCGCQRTSPPGL